MFICKHPILPDYFYNRSVRLSSFRQIMFHMGQRSLLFLLTRMIKVAEAAIKSPPYSMKSLRSPVSGDPFVFFGLCVFVTV